MKTITTLLASFCVLYLAAFAAENQTVPAKNPSALVGTWELTLEKWGDEKDFTAPPANRRALKFITPTHFIWAWVDPKTKKVTNSMGGTYRLDGDSYVERVEFAFEGMGAYVGKEQKFTAKLEGDKWTHSGILSEGQKLEEIWKRVK